MVFGRKVKLFCCASHWVKKLCFLVRKRARRVHVRAVSSEPDLRVCFNISLQESRREWPLFMSQYNHSTAVLRPLKTKQVLLNMSIILDSASTAATVVFIVTVCATVSSMSHKLVPAQQLFGSLKKSSRYTCIGSTKSKWTLYDWYWRIRIAV